MHAGFQGQGEGQGKGFLPWIDAGDETACFAALEALQFAGALTAHDRRWLEPALRQEVGAPLGIATPWASWAVRIGERVRLPIPAGALAIIVTALNTRRSAAAREHEVPDGVTRWSLAFRVLGHAIGERDPLMDRIASWLLGLGEYPAASAPRNPPLAAPANLSSAQPSRVRASVGVREAVVLWTLPALLADQDALAWSEFGTAVAAPIALLGDLARLWLDPDACDLRDATLTPLVDAWLAEPPLVPPLLRAYAGERASAVRHAEIHLLLASEPYRARVRSVTRRALNSARDRLPSSDTSDLHAAAAGFLDALGEGFRAFDALMALRTSLDPRSAASPPQVPGHARRDDAVADTRMALAFLSEGAPWPGSWEVQRFGVFGSQDQPVGQWFARGLILRALLDMYYGVRDEASQLLGEIPPGELRYFGPWRDIPPDADDLGLMLELVAATGAARDRAETWIVVLLANTDERGVAPTYFSRDPAGRATTPSGKAWPGNDCNAVRLQLLCGLLAFDAARFSDLIQANATRVLADSRAGAVGGSYYYGARYTDLAFLRFARLYRAKAVERPLWGGIAAAAAAIRARMAVGQRLDGGWGSPQRTAFCLTGCAMELGVGADPDPLLLERGLRSLGEHQLVDGSWPAEPLWRVPMKRGREGFHQGRALTTAFCAHALHASLAAMPR